MIYQRPPAYLSSSAALAALVAELPAPTTEPDCRREAEAVELMVRICHDGPTARAMRDALRAEVARVESMIEEVQARRVEVLS